MLLPTLISIALAGTAQAHTAAFAKGMYCKGGANSNQPVPHNNLPVNPLYQLQKADWWFQHHRGCDAVPPPAGEFLDIPAGGQFTVELAHNIDQTTLIPGSQVSDWPDGKQHPEDWHGPNGDCIQDDGALHTKNQTHAAGTAFAISYKSNLAEVTMENLVVFTTLKHTPWKRLATYKVPAAMPACPPGGCTCAWLWVPDGCGEPNMYMQGFKCRVTGATSAAPLAVAKPPVYCKNDQSQCVKGAKQMIAWQQATGNNISPPDGASPAYSTACGFADGAQNDIFQASSRIQRTANSKPKGSRSRRSGPKRLARF